MASNLETGGTDLDSVFAAYVSGQTKAANTGIESGGVDIANRYAKLIYGAAAAATGIKSGSADLNTIFAGYGTLMAASITPATLSFGTNTPQSGNTLVTVSGGTAPYSYNWTKTILSGTGSFSITSGSTAVRCYWTMSWSTAEGIVVTLKCSVTDAHGNVVNASQRISGS